MMWTGVDLFCHEEIISSPLGPKKYLDGQFEDMNFCSEFVFDQPNPPFYKNGKLVPIDRPFGVRKRNE